MSGPEPLESEGPRDLLAEAMVGWWGKRCVGERERECVVCRAWEQLDDLHGAQRLLDELWLERRW